MWYRQGKIKVLYILQQNIIVLCYRISDLKAYMLVTSIASYTHWQASIGPSLVCIISEILFFTQLVSKLADQLLEMQVEVENSNTSPGCIIWKRLPFELDSLKARSLSWLIKWNVRSTISLIGNSNTSSGCSLFLQLVFILFYSNEMIETVRVLEHLK